MLIYRVEDRNGNGPFRDLKFCLAWTARKSKTSSINDLESKYPPVHEDIRPFNFDMRCATTSLKHLADWFDCCIDILQRGNFSIVVYEIEEGYVTYGTRQAAFFLNEASVVEKLPVKILAEYA